MKYRLSLIGFLLFIFNYTFSQEVEERRGLLGENNNLTIIPDSLDMNGYSDSLKQVFGNNIITGYIVSSFNELIGNLALEYSLNNSSFEKLLSDRYGRFNIPGSFQKSTHVRIRINNNKYKILDSVYYIDPNKQQHLKIELFERYRILIRGKIIAGTLPIEDVRVVIRHRNDTFNLKTLSCYFDSDDYWNCLYLGMFKQAVSFDNPDDSIFITIQKEGFDKQNILFKCGDYDGRIIQVKLKYSNKLPYFPKHNISFKYAPPLNNIWNVGFSYLRFLRISNFNRLGLGVEAGMLISEERYEHPTFPDTESFPDTMSIMAVFDTIYSAPLIIPQIIFNITSPYRRYFSFYTGIGFPVTFPSYKISAAPYIGSRYYLDINKAIVVEIKYLTYDLNLVRYKFNPYGNSERTTINREYNKLLFRIGIQISL